MESVGLGRRQQNSQYNSSLNPSLGSGSNLHTQALKSDEKFLVLHLASAPPRGPAGPYETVSPHSQALAHYAGNAPTVYFAGHPRTQPSWELHGMSPPQSLAEGLIHLVCSVLSVQWVNEGARSVKLKVGAAPLTLPWEKTQQSAY